MSIKFCELATSELDTTVTGATSVMLSTSDVSGKDGEVPEVSPLGFRNTTTEQTQRTLITRCQNDECYEILLID